MKGGWEEAWPEGKKNYTSEKKFRRIFDKKLQKEMKKSAAGHNLLNIAVLVITIQKN